MPIDDALKRIDREEEPEQGNEPDTHIDIAEFDKIMRSYLAALKKGYNSFDDEKMAVFAKWMRFNENFETVIKPIQRKEMIELISKYDPKFAELGEVSDITEYIDYTCDITRRKTYEKLELVTKMKNIADYEQIELFCKLGRNVIIPNLSYLSLFIKEEEKLRRYAKEIKEEYSTGAVLTITDLKLAVDPEISFNTSELADFCRLTHITDITNMLHEVNDLIQDIRRIKNPFAIRKYLFARIKKYYPDLCYAAKKKDFGPEEHLTLDEIQEEDSGENLPDAYDLLEDDIPDFPKGNQEERDREMRGLNDLEMMDREIAAMRAEDKKNNEEGNTEDQGRRRPVGDIFGNPSATENEEDDDIPF